MQKSHYHDSEIIQRILNGERDLYRVLLDRYRREMFIRANRITPRQVDCEDVVQETFVRAFFRLKDFRPAGNVRSWLYGIMRNVVGDYYRDVERKKEVSLDSFSSYIADLAERAPVPQEKERFLEWLQECMGGLAEKSRTLVTLRYEERKSSAEIGRLYSQTQYAVNVALMRIRRKLRDCVKSHMRLEP